MKWCKWAAMVAAVMLVPQWGFSQSIPAEIRGLQGVLNKLYDEMLPMCGDLIGVGRAIAGFAATFYIGHRVWKNIANAEPIDFYPLFRPFVLGFCVLNFPMIINLTNSILQTTVVGTEKMKNNSDKAIVALLQKKEEEIKKSPFYEMYGSNNGEGNRELWLEYAHPEAAKSGEGWLDGIGYDVQFAVSKAFYNMKGWFKQALSFFLQVLYEAAALCINTMRTFNLLILAILGPFVFGFAVFDGFQHTLQVWLARYVHTFLWLPIANIFGSVIGKIQEQMLKIDIDQVQEYGDTFFSSTDIGYLIFMIIAIVGYTTIPNVAGHVVHVGSGSALSSKISSMSSSFAGKTAGAATTVVSGGVGMAADAMGDVALGMSHGVAGQGAAGGYFKDKISG